MMIFRTTQGFKLVGVMTFLFITSSEFWGKVDGWADDIFYYTSFRNVSEWMIMYPQCGYIRPDNPKIGIGRRHLSPIALPDHKECHTQSKTCMPLEELHYFEHLKNRPKSVSLKIYINPPPNKLSYTVSFGFQKNKKCLENSYFNPCYIPRSLGLIRGLVLNAEREDILKIRRDFSIEEPEKFVSIVTGLLGEKIEKKFYEAIFMGNPEGSSKERSTHTIGGKSFPMEIYMFFLDETIPVMHDSTVLVVLVEESETDNQEIKPIVKAVKNKLYEAERRFFKTHEYIAQRERSYHHAGISCYENTCDPKNKVDKTGQLAESWVIHQDETNTYEEWEKLQVGNRDVVIEREQVELIVDELSTFINDYFNLAELSHECPARDNNTESYRYWLYPAILKAILIDPDDPTNNNISIKFFNSLYKRELNATLVLRYYFSRDDKDALCDPSCPSCRKVPLVTNEKEKKVFNLTLDFYQKMITFEKSRTPDKKQITVDEEYRMKYLDGFKKFRNQTKPGGDTDANTAYHNLWKILMDILGLTEDKELDTKNKIKFPDFQKEIQEFREYLHLRKEIVRLKSSLNFTARNKGYSYRDAVEVYDYKALRNQIEIDLKSRKEFYEKDALFNSTKKRKGSLVGGNFNLSNEDFNFYEELNPEKVPLDSVFQISWLIPKGGGYYVYEGSSPVPPCFEADETIIFRKTIKMSKEQIRILTTMPTSWLPERDIRNTLGKFNEHRNQSTLGILFEKNNHVFLGEDGVHKNSILEAKRRNETKTNNDATTFSLNNNNYHSFIFSFAFQILYGVWTL